MENRSALCSALQQLLVEAVTAVHICRSFVLLGLWRGDDSKIMFSGSVNLTLIFRRLCRSEEILYSAQASHFLKAELFVTCGKCLAVVHRKYGILRDRMKHRATEICR